MRLSFEYDTSYPGPAFPVMELIIGGAKNRHHQTVALIDSGADATHVPTAILERIKARRVDSRWARTINNQRYMAYVYRVTVQVGDYEIPAVEVMANTTTDETIIGRDVLNQLIVTLNGLPNTTTISDLP